MRKGIFLIAIPLMAGIGLWLGFRATMLSVESAATPARPRSDGVNPTGTANDTQAFRTKASNRGFSDSSATHRPEQLKDFMLPEVAIDGLYLDAALRKLLAIYQEACRKTGETPLDLKFVVPAQTGGKLDLRLTPGSFNASVQLLATLSRMKVTRCGMEYRFEAIKDLRRPVKRNLDVPPNFQSVLNDLKGGRDAQLPVRDLINRLGIGLDPSTRLTLDPSGKLAMETHSTSDAAAVSALARTLADQRPTQHQFTAKVLELPRDAKWTPPDLAQLDNSQLQSFMDEMAREKGTELKTLPSLTTRSGQIASSEITREFITPTDETATTFETHNIGIVMKVQGAALGFGHDLAFDYTDTTGDIDTATMKPVIHKRIDVNDSGFSSDGGTRFVIQTRPDGSRSIVLLTSALIDATGRPLR